VTVVVPEVEPPGTPRAPARRRRERSAGQSLGVYALQRILTGLGTTVFVIVVNFFLFHLLPGDPLANYTRGRNVDQTQIRALRKAYSGPLWDQFRHYIHNPFSSRIDSQQFSQPVWTVIGDHMWATILLVGTSTLLSTVFGIMIGIRAGWTRGSRFDKWSTAITLVLYAMPEFWLGMMLLIAFSTGAGPFPALFPSGGIHEATTNQASLAGIWDITKHLCLPCLTLTLVYLAEYSLVMRASILEEKSQDYLQTARAKGLRDRLVRRRHAVPNALLPTITLVFLNIGFIVSGAVTVETVFSWPGLGELSFEAIRGPDIPLLQALFLLFSVAVIVWNIVADIVVATVDPRTRS
jgi:peptide/nickel transport system permease protein